MSSTEPLLIDFSLSPRQAAEPGQLKISAARAAGLDAEAITSIRIIRRSIDARKKPVKIALRVSLSTGAPTEEPAIRRFQPRKSDHAQEVLVFGAGPAGLFAALRLLELGFKPILFERGKKVEDRKRDVALLNRNVELNPDSNYCFGEGGAGTFSDGKLYTRSKKRGEISDVLELLVHFGAHPDILIDAHPHIGSDKLPAIIRNIRQAIIDAGGYIGFNTALSDLEISGGRVSRVLTSNGDVFVNLPVILATGHSARDVYDLLNRSKVLLEPKGFAMGVRVEHPQELIDQIQYHSPQGRGDYLPAAEYSISAQANKRGVYSFCMCPGGTIVPASTALGETVVNGMSNARRSSPFANSGLVVEIRESDLGAWKRHGVLAGLAYQQELESLSQRNGGNGFSAPAQRISDFIRGSRSSSLPVSSYHPGLQSSPMHQWLPSDISSRLRVALKNFENRMKGFGGSEGIMVGVESRTSSPVRIPRRSDTWEHILIGGLYPCGEGAGYAGGIVSSALDGMLSAEALVRNAGF